MHVTDFEIGELFELGLQILAHRLGPLDAAGDGLALAVVDHDGEYVLQLLAVFLLQLRIGERKHDQRVGRETKQRTSRRTPEQEREQQYAERGQGPKHGPGYERSEFDRPVHRAHCPNRSSKAGTCTWSAL